MRTRLPLLAALSFAPIALSSSACQVACIEDGSGTTCTAKSLKRFDGTPTSQAFDYVPGSPVTIDVEYGNITVGRSASGRVEVAFQPFEYAAHDDAAGAQRRLAQNLQVGAVAQNGIVVSARRAGGSNGLGANAIVRLPDQFNGPLNVVNRGAGPINEFEVRIEFVGQASALQVTNQSDLGDCWVQGAPSVRSTTVQCGDVVSVFDVSDAVTISNNERRHNARGPAVTLRMASISPGSPGGKITSASGPVNATFPAAGGYTVTAQSPVRGVVQEGALPPACKKSEAGPNNKTIACGQGPTYAITAGTAPSYVKDGQDGNVVLAYR